MRKPELVETPMSPKKSGLAMEPSTAQSSSPTPRKKERT